MMGLREPEIYGRDSFSDLKIACTAKAKALSLDLDFCQSNYEGELITWTQKARGNRAGIIINPAGYGHSSVALLDALLATELPVIEVHLSNIHRRENFRHHTYTSKAATGVICGLGIQGYLMALEAMKNLIKTKKANS